MPPSGDWTKLHAECRGWPLPHEWGHWFTLWLEVFGLNKRRWNWLRVKFGFTKPCGCGKREAALNKLGATVASSRGQG